MFTCLVHRFSEGQRLSLFRGKYWKRPTHYVCCRLIGCNTERRKIKREVERFCDEGGGNLDPMRRHKI